MFTYFRYKIAFCPHLLLVPHVVLGGIQFQLVIRSTAIPEVTVLLNSAPFRREAETGHLNLAGNSGKSRYRYF